MDPDRPSTASSVRAVLAAVTALALWRVDRRRQQT